MTKFYNSDAPMAVSGLADALAKVGLLPPECVSVEIIAGGIEECMRIRYEVYVKASDMWKLAEAFAQAHKGATT